MLCVSTLTPAERVGDTQRERKTGQLGHPQIKEETDMWKHTELRERHTIHQHVVYMLDVSSDKVTNSIRDSNRSC